MWLLNTSIFFEFTAGNASQWAGWKKNMSMVKVFKTKIRFICFSFSSPFLWCSTVTIEKKKKKKKKKMKIPSLDCKNLFGVILEACVYKTHRGSVFVLWTLSIHWNDNYDFVSQSLFLLPLPSAYGTEYCDGSFWSCCLVLLPMALY